MAKAKEEQYSKYWINQDLWDDLDSDLDIDTKDAKSEKNEQTLARLMRLAGLRRAVGNFVQIMTEQNIPVHFSNGKQSSTANQNQAVIIAADEDPRKFDVTVGLSLHESAHILLSDKHLPMVVSRVADDMNVGVMTQITYITVENGAVVPIDMRVTNATKNPERKTLAHLMLPPALQEVLDINFKRPMGHQLAAKMMRDIMDIAQVMEDRRIDQYVYTTAQGYRPYYDALYNKYFFTKEIGKNLRFNPEWRIPTVENYINRLILMFHPEAEKDALPGLSELFDLFDLNNISRLSGGSVEQWGRTHKYEDLPTVWKEACKLYMHVLRYAIIVEPPPPQGGGNGDGEGEGGGGEGGEDGENGEGNQPQSQNSQDQQNKDNAEKSALEKILEHLNNSLPNLDDNADMKPKPVQQPSGREKGAFNEKRANNDIRKAKSVMQGDIAKKKISDAEKVAVESVEEAAAEIVDITGHGVPFGNCIVTRKLTQKVLDSEWFPFSGSHTRTVPEATISAGRRMGAILLKRLEVRNDPKLSKQTRLKTGGLDRRLLAQLGMDITSVFQRTRVDQYRPAMLHLSLDASGSMNGSKWDKVVSVAVALAYVGSKSNNIDTVITLRGGIDIPVVAVVFDSRVDTFNKFLRNIQQLAPRCNTPEGLCFKATLGLITECADTHDVYFINFSDGEPSYWYDRRQTLSTESGYNDHFSYHGEVAIEHTRSMVNLIRQSGVKVMSYFISETNKFGYTRAGSSETFKRMYGQDAQYINVQNTFEVLRTLNKLLLNAGA